MELIWLFTMIILLAQHSIADYTKTTTSGNWTDIRNECNLATPTIMYSAEDLTADFGTDIELDDGEKLWVGYIEDFEIYRFYGCINQQYLTDRNALGDGYAVEKKDAVGLCYSACRNTIFFGVMENEENVGLCYCIHYTDQTSVTNARTGLTSCNSSDEKGFAFGRRQFLAIYERVSTNLSKGLKKLDTWNDVHKNCLRFFNPSSQTLQWFQCYLFNNVLCANSQEEAIFLHTYHPWKRAVDYCFENSLFPFAYQSRRFSSNLTLQYWLANTRSMTITKDIGQNTSKYTKYGYIVKENTTLVLRFEEREEELKGLCFEDLAVAERTPVATTDKSKLSSTTDSGHRVEESSEKSNELVGIYVGVTVVIVLAISVVIVLGTVLLLKRKRRANQEKIDNTRRNLTYESNIQPNQNISAHRPDSPEVNHEIQDVTESINEGYDTIPDGYLQKSMQNNNTAVAYFVLEKHDNADYELAKEVIGEAEHVYDRKPINTAVAITDDYDHIGKGNAILKQSLGEQPYDTISSVKQKDHDPTYDHTGDHTTYNYTLKHHDHTGDHLTYDHTWDNADYDHTGNHNSYDHTGDVANYDHTGDQTNYDHTGDQTNYDHTKDLSDKTYFKV